MRSKAIVASVVGIAVVVFAVSAAYAHGTYCRHWHSATPEVAAAASGPGQPADVDTQTMRADGGGTHAQVVSCGCPWYRRWVGWHRHGCSRYADNCTHGRMRGRQSSGCCW
jgi:hypothetical protein